MFQQTHAGVRTVASAVPGRAFRMALCAAASVAAFAILADAPAAQAQAQAAKPANGAALLDDVVVTARRIEERIQDVPVTVTALSQAKLDALQVNNTSDLVKLTPGLQVNSCTAGTPPGGSACFPSIRGFAASRGVNSGSVAIYFADAPSMFTSNYDLQSIQVVKGPQGTLFGDQTTGGAILFTPRKPSGKTEGFVTAELGNFGYHQLTAAYENALFDNKVMFRVAGQYRKRDGFTTVHYTFQPDGKYNNVDQLYLRGSLVIKPTDRIENYTVVVFQEEKYSGGGGPVLFSDPRYIPLAQRVALTPTQAALYEFYSGHAPPAGQSFTQIIASAIARQAAAGPDEVWSDEFTKTDTQNVGVVNQFRVDITDKIYVRDISQLRWVPKLSRGGANYDGIDAPVLGLFGFQNLPLTRGAGVGATPYTFKNGYDNRQWTNEVQVVGSSFADRLQWQAGYFYRPDRAGNFDGPYPYSNNPPQGPTVENYGNLLSAVTAAATCTSVGSPNPCVRFSRTSRTTDAFYTQATFEVIDRLKLTGGVRYTRTSRLLTENAAFPGTTFSYTASNGVTVAAPIVAGGQVPYPSAPIVSSVTPGYKSTTYTLTADYKLTDDILLYANRRKGFRPGGINISAPIDSPVRTYGPEQLLDTEVGFKSSWSLMGINGRTNVSYYRDNYSNIQTSTVFIGTPGTFTVNGGEAIFQGAEFEASANLTSWFSLSGHVDWQDNKYTSYLETQTCAAQVWRQGIAGQCAELVGATLVPLPTGTGVTIDHANGTVTIAATAPSAAIPLGTPARTYKYDTKSEPIRGVPWTWAIRPEIHLEQLLGEKVTVALDIYHSGGRGGFVTASNAGVPNFEQLTWDGVENGNTALWLPKYTNVDLNIDWREIKGSTVSAFLRVSNLTDNRYRLISAGLYTSSGLDAPAVSEPRMILVGAKYEF